MASPMYRHDAAHPKAYRSSFRKPCSNPVKAVGTSDDSPKHRTPRAFRAGQRRPVARPDATNRPGSLPAGTPSARPVSAHGWPARRHLGRPRALATRTPRPLRNSRARHPFDQLAQEFSVLTLHSQKPPQIAHMVWTAVRLGSGDGPSVYVQLQIGPPADLCYQIEHTIGLAAGGGPVHVCLFSVWRLTLANANRPGPLRGYAPKPNLAITFVRAAQPGPSTGTPPARSGP